MDRDYHPRVTCSTFGEAEEPRREAERERIRCVASQRMADAEAVDTDIRRVGPLEQLCEQIANLRARLLSTTDDLAHHSSKVTGEEIAGNSKGLDTRDLGREVSAANIARPPALLDRLFCEVSSLEAALCYTEQQVQRATVLS